MKNNVVLRSTIAGLFACGCLASVQASAAMGSAAVAPQGTLLGTFPSPPKGPGPGQVASLQLGTKSVTTTTFGTPHTASGNSFYPAYDARNHTAYVPTVVGTTYLLNPGTLETTGHFKSIPGGRVARVTPNNRMLLVLSGKKLAAYSTAPGHARLFTLPVGGNAIALSPDGRFAFVGGNMGSHLTEIRLPAGRIVHKFPIKRTGDLVWAQGQVFSADMKTGTVSALNPRTGKIVAISTPEKDPTFSYHNILGATAGIMQLAVSPNGQKVYGAGFSGHILVLSARNDTYLGEVPVSANANGPDKLSGLAVVNHGRDAVTTVENLKETVTVRLSDGKILLGLQHTAANRWVATGS